jgi:hypothetical protein
MMVVMMMMTNHARLIEIHFEIEMVDDDIQNVIFLKSPADLKLTVPRIVIAAFALTSTDWLLTEVFLNVRFQAARRFYRTIHDRFCGDVKQKRASDWRLVRFETQCGFGLMSG